MKYFLLFLLWSLWFLNFSTRTILSPILPVIEDELFISHAFAGSLFSFLACGYACTLLLSGPIASRIGHKKSIALGFIILIVTLFSMKYATNYFSMCVTSFFIGMGSGLYMPSAIPTLTGIFKQNNWGKAIAIHDTGASFSILFIPLLTVLGLRFCYWRTLFLLLSAVCVVMTACFWKFIPDHSSTKEEKVRFSHIFRRRDFWVIAVLWIFAAASNLGIYNVIPLFLVKEKGIALETANTIFGFSRVGGFFVALLAGVLSDKYGVKKLLYVVLLATGISTMGMAIAGSFPMLVVMLVVQATICTGFFPVGLLAASKLTSFHERTIFTGTSIAGGVIAGLGLTPFLLGAVADVWNFQTGIFFLGVLTTLSCILLRYLPNI